MKNLSLNMKMIAVFAIFALGAMAIGFVGDRSLAALHEALSRAVQTHVPRLQVAVEIQSEYRLLALRHQQYLTAENKEEAAGYQKGIDKGRAEMNGLMEDALERASEKGRPIVEATKTGFELWWEKGEAARAAKAAGDDAKAHRITKEMREIRIGSEDSLAKLVELNRNRLKEEDEATSALFERARATMIAVCVGSILLASILAAIVLRSASAAIQRVISDLAEGSQQVTAASHQIASSSEELSQSATEQAASLEQTAASIEELNSMIAKNTENARSTEKTSSDSQAAVGQGKEIVKRMMESMAAINRSSEGMAETVKVIEQIDKKTKVINEIVNKTELLSFNASVEAARAGEHGKGFAVVAEEVGNLARMSGSAAEEIASLLEDSIRAVNQMVQETKKNVDAGASIARECEQVFEGIVANVANVSQMATEISSASQEQARGCAEISKAMAQLDQMTQQNASTSEECASSAEQLAAQAASLNSAVEHLVRAINGGSGASVPRAEARASMAAPRAGAGKSPSGNVVRLTEPRSPRRRAKGAAVLKQAAGEPPSYDSEGFHDV